MNKLKILFAMHYEAGHNLGTFKLAKKLQFRGHEIVYLSAPDLKELIENQGFKFVTFMDDLLPSRYDNKTISNDKSFISHWNRRRYYESVFSQYLKKITDGTLDKCLLSVNADILLCDPFLSYVAIRALSLGIPTIHIFTSLFLYENPYIPPIIRYMQPESRIGTLMAWKYMFLKFFFVKKLKNIITGEFNSPSRMQHLVDAYLQVARKSGYPCKKDKTYRLNEIGLNLVLPEIVLCTKTFQFPGNIPEQRLYLGNFVDFERKENQAELNIDDRPLIFCSLGTSASSYPKADRFFQAVTQASKLRKDWQFVLQISDADKIKNYSSTQNLIILKWVPQLFLLKKAAVMVTHGGLNSIMECVNFEVPMVIVPCMRDQPGNAARAVYHNIALTVNMKEIEPFILIKLIIKAMESNEIKNGLKKMKDKIEKEDGLEQSANFIESYTISKKKKLGT